MKKLTTHIVLLFCFLLILTACGRNKQDNNKDKNVTESSSHTLTIFASDEFIWDRFALHDAEDLMAAAWAEQGKNFSIEFTGYTQRERETALTRLHVMIMAGQVPDIIMLDHAPWTDTISLRNFLGSGAFANFTLHFIYLVTP
ncbi:MAG: hypothetical protein FWC32_04770 [Firmicutes bacterium]|nr:hypothetical protein [Bacillota bacterium]